VIDNFHEMSADFEHSFTIRLSITSVKHYHYTFRDTTQAKADSSAKYSCLM